MRWQLHDIIIEGTSDNATLCQSWQSSFASLPTVAGEPDIRLKLDIVAGVPEPPALEAHYRHGDSLAYFLAGQLVTAHFPRFGLLQLDLAHGTTAGQLVGAVLDTYGVLEDLIAISLSAHLRRRGLFLLHAFAAADQDRALLLVGDIGAGKTTTGMALLNAGWRLLSNDSPIINNSGEVLSYPGALAAYPATFALFEKAASAKQAPPKEGRPKIAMPAEAIWPGVWRRFAPVGAIVFPQVEARSEHLLEPLSAPETLRRLLPHAVEQWDRAMIPAHLTALRTLVDAAPGYSLRLGPDVMSLPPLLATALPRTGIYT